MPDSLSHRVARFLHPLAAPATRRDRWILFAVFVLLTLCRLPKVVTQGRFWAEEARVFYFYAALAPWPKALVFSFAGYMNLGANVASVAARYLVPLDYAPRMTLAFAFAAQICPALLLITASDAWLRGRAALAMALWLMVAAPSGEEVWLNSLHSQFFLALSAALILALATGTGGRETFRRVLLFLAPLYGLVAITLLPLFAIRSWLDRSRARLIQTLWLAGGAAIQLVFFYRHDAHRQAAGVKLILAVTFAKNLLLPFLSFDGSQPLAAWLHTSVDQGILPLTVIVALVLAVALVFTLLAKGPATGWWLVLACGIIMEISYYGALFPSSVQIDPHTGGRYSFVSQVLFAWVLLAIAAGGSGWRAKIALVLTLWLSVASLNAYLHPALGFTHGPKWRKEIAKWHANPNYSPHAWPDGALWVVPMPASNFKPRP